MKSCFGVLLWASVSLAQVIPGYFIVELSEEPAVSAAGKPGSRREATADRRALVRSQQGRARQALAAQHVQVIDSVETVANALLVRAPNEEACRSVAGVARIHPVYELKAALDHALPLHRVPEAWSQIGGWEQAGAGMKIGILDSGIDPSHPGFQDPSLLPPAGFPRAGNASDLRYTNNKIIVARSYENLFSRTDSGPRDRSGHGTAVAMTAAGVPNAGPLARISGVAPKAFLGNYRVTAGADLSTRVDVVLKALDDAIADGMDVINLSFARQPAPRLADDLLAQAVERAAGLGVVVILPSGNGGPDPNTVQSPGTAPSAITVGSSQSDRGFGGLLIMENGPVYLAVPGNGFNPADPLTAPLTDVAQIAAPGLACNPLPASSLSGKTALIVSGQCSFEQKLNNAESAGAVAAVISADQSTLDAFSIDVGGASLPASMVGYADGVDIRTQLASNPSARATLDFSPRRPYPLNPALVAEFSSRGPTAETSIKPDLLTVGSPIYTAAQTLDSSGEFYDPNGYILLSGTSLSAPLVTGAAAVLKAARPNLTAQQYRSLLIDSAGPISRPGRDTPAPVQFAGAGLLNLNAALRSTISAAPVALNFGTGGSDPDVTRNLTISNLGSAADTFTLSVLPNGPGPSPSVVTDSVQLDPGATTDLAVRWNASGLAPGEYDGFIRIHGVNGEVDARIPYWYAVPAQEPAHLTVLSSVSNGAPGARVLEAITLRITDASGIPLTGLQPKVTAYSGGGRVLSVSLQDSKYPGAYSIDVQLGSQPDDDFFLIEIGGLSQYVLITAS